MKLSRDFYLQDTLTVSKNLLGKILCRKKGDTVLKGLITEVEAYCGVTDKACHSYNNRRTTRVEPMYKIGGTIYVYFIYGMYYCFNVVTRDTLQPEAVLIRSIEPINGIDIMSLNRYNKEFDSLSKSQKINLTNGPGKICAALSIDKHDSGKDLTGDEIWIEDIDYKDFKIRFSKRIGIENTEEAKDYLYRMILSRNNHSLDK